jgi:hypothetical protein
MSWNVYGGLWRLGINGGVEHAGRAILGIYFIKSSVLVAKGINGRGVRMSEFSRTPLCRNKMISVL